MYWTRVQYWQTLYCCSANLILAAWSEDVVASVWAAILGNLKGEATSWWHCSTTIPARYCQSLDVNSFLSFSLSSFLPLPDPPPSSPSPFPFSLSQSNYQSILVAHFWSNKLLQTFSGLLNTSLLSYSSVGQKSNTGPTGPKTKS